MQMIYNCFYPLHFAQWLNFGYGKKLDVPQLNESKTEVVLLGKSRLAEKLKDNLVSLTHFIKMQFFLNKAQI